MGRQAGRGGEVVALLWWELVSLPPGPAGLQASFLVLSEEQGAAGCSLPPRLGIASNVWHPSLSLKEKTLNVGGGMLETLHYCTKVSF